MPTTERALGPTSFYFKFLGEYWEAGEWLFLFYLCSVAGKFGETLPWAPFPFCIWILCIILYPLIDSLSAPWSLSLALPSLRPHTHAAACQPGISAGLAHLIHTSVSWSLGCDLHRGRERLWLGSGCSLSVRMQLLLCRPLRCSVWLGLCLPLCRRDGVVLYSLSLYIYSIKEKKGLKKN